MDTVVTIEVVTSVDDAAHLAQVTAALHRAETWVRDVEARCSRFDESSELRMLTARSNVPVPASPMLFEAVAFALAVAADTNGVFDPTVGDDMVRAGFDREHRSGVRVAPRSATDGVSYRDVALDASARTVMTSRPLTLDLGAVAKGLAVDLAAQELGAYPDLAIDAGGDVYVRGKSARGERWAVGIRNPRGDGVLDTVCVDRGAVCTSGDYERTARDGEGHVLDARTRRPVQGIASATVIAPTAMAADALATAAFALGPRDGIAFIERNRAAGMIVTDTLERYVTTSWARD